MLNFILVIIFYISLIAVIVFLLSIYFTFRSYNEYDPIIYKKKQLLGFAYSFVLCIISNILIYII